MVFWLKDNRARKYELCHQKVTKLASSDSCNSGQDNVRNEAHVGALQKAHGHDDEHGVQQKYTRGSMSGLDNVEVSSGAAGVCAVVVKPNSETRFQLWRQLFLHRYYEMLKNEVDIVWTETTDRSGKHHVEDLITVFTLGRANVPEDKLFVITVYLTAAKFMVQGKKVQDWLEDELPLLCSVVDNARDGSDIMILCDDIFSHEKDEELDLDNTVEDHVNPPSSTDSLVMLSPFKAIPSTPSLSTPQSLLFDVPYSLLSPVIFSQSFTDKAADDTDVVETSQIGQSNLLNTIVSTTPDVHVESEPDFPLQTTSEPLLPLPSVSSESVSQSQSNEPQLHSADEDNVSVNQSQKNHPISTSSAPNIAAVDKAHMDTKVQVLDENAATMKQAIETLQSTWLLNFNELKNENCALKSVTNTLEAVVKSLKAQVIDLKAQTKHASKKKRRSSSDKSSDLLSLEPVIEIAQAIDGASPLLNDTFVVDPSIKTGNRFQSLSSVVFKMPSVISPKQTPVQEETNNNTSSVYSSESNPVDSSKASSSSDRTSSSPTVHGPEQQQKQSIQTLVVGSSNTRDIRPGKFVYSDLRSLRLSATYTEDATSIIQNCDYDPNLIILHVGSNDINDDKPTPVIMRLQSEMVAAAVDNFPNGKIVVCGIPLQQHPGHEERNEDILNIHRATEEQIETSHHEDITFINNSRFFDRRSGALKSDLLKQDGLHYSSYGVKSLCKAICMCLNQQEKRNAKLPVIPSRPVQDARLQGRSGRQSYSSTIGATKFRSGSPKGIRGSRTNLSSSRNRNHHPSTSFNKRNRHQSHPSGQYRDNRNSSNHGYKNHRPVSNEQPYSRPDLTTRPDYSDYRPISTNEQITRRPVSNEKIPGRPFYSACSDNFYDDRHPVANDKSTGIRRPDYYARRDVVNRNDEPRRHPNYDYNEDGYTHRDIDNRQNNHFTQSNGNFPWSNSDSRRAAYEYDTNFPPLTKDSDKLEPVSSYHLSEYSQKQHRFGY